MFETKNLAVIPIVVGAIGTNCYLVMNKNTKDAFVVDPGAEADAIARWIEKEQAKLQGILLTHGHFDHIMAVNELKEQYPVEVFAAEAETELLMDADLNCSNGFGMGRGYIVKPDRTVRDSEQIELAGVTIKVIETPGHTKGGVCFYLEKEKLLFCGDTLFQESVGRSDLPTGSGATLVRSLRDKVFVLPEDVTAFPGHGPRTDIGHEKKYNPFA